jgi:hypothetical protein
VGVAGWFRWMGRGGVGRGGKGGATGSAVKVKPLTAKRICQLRVLALEH